MNNSTNEQVTKMKMVLISFKQMVEEKFPFVSVSVDQKRDIFEVKMFYLKWHNILKVYVKYKKDKSTYFILQNYKENNTYMLMRLSNNYNLINEKIANQLEKCVVPIITLYKEKPLVYKYKDNSGIYKYSLHQFTTKITEPILIDEIDTNELLIWLHELNFIEENKLEFIYQTIQRFMNDKKKLNNLLYELIKYAE